MRFFMNNEVANVQTEINKLGEKATQAEVIETLNAIIDQLATIKVRDRGPKSTKSMTEELARKVLLEEPHCNMSHKKAAIELGLAYGQVSSVRGGYTFKRQYKEWESAGSKKTWDRDYIA